MWINGRYLYFCKIFIDKLGDIYEGEFKACLKHGFGREKFANGDMYVGHYINGRPEGEGTYFWKDESIYKGAFKNGLRHGVGDFFPSIKKINIYFYKIQNRILVKE